MTISTPRTACGSCAAPLGVGDAFCGACGTPVTPQVPGRRRHDRVASGTDARPATPPLAEVEGLTEAGSFSPTRAAGHQCPACGTVPVPLDRACPTCREQALVLPASARWDVGLLFRVRRGLRPRPALCIAVDGSGRTVLVPDGTLLVVGLDQAPTAPTLPPSELAEIRTSPGVLLRYARAAAEDPTSHPWPVDTLVHAALDALHTRRDRSVARLVALDALRLGRPDLLPHLGLPITEAHWLALVDAAGAGRVDDVVTHAAALPPGRYRSAIHVLAALLPQLVTRPAVGERLAGFLGGHRDDPLAAVVARRLGVLAAHDGDRWSDADLRARVTPLPDLVRSELVALLAPHLVGKPSSSPTLLGRAGRVLHARLHGTADTLSPQDIAHLGPAALDDLVDAGLVAADDVDQLPAGRARAHLRARLCPDRLDTDELDAHPGERARRALQEGGGEAVGADPRLATLTAIRRARWDDVRADAVHDVERPVVEALLAGRTDGRRLLDDAVLRDRSLWPVVAELLDGDLAVVDDGVRGHSPSFAGWLDLREAREHLFLARWSRAADAARRCLATSPEESVRDEALNVLACALHLRGDARAAVAALAKAVEGEYSPALLANLAITSAEVDRQSAAPHLVRIARESPRAGLRRQAALRALRYWREDPDFWEGDEQDRVVPPVLRGMLREAVLDDGLSREDFRALALALSTRDGAWFGSADALRRSPHRDSTEARWFQARARDDVTARVQILLDASKVGALEPWLQSARDAMAEAVRSSLVDRLDDEHTDLGYTAIKLSAATSGSQDHHLCLLGVASVAIQEKETTADELHPDIVGLLMSQRTVLDVLRGQDGLETVFAAEELATRRVEILERTHINRRVKALLPGLNEACRMIDLISNPDVDLSSQYGRARSAVTEIRNGRARLQSWLPLIEDDAERGYLRTNISALSDVIAQVERMTRGRL